MVVEEGEVVGAVDPIAGPSVGVALTVGEHLDDAEDEPDGRVAKTSTAATPRSECAALRMTLPASLEESSLPGSWQPKEHLWGARSRTGR